MIYYILGIFTGMWIATIVLILTKKYNVPITNFIEKPSYGKADIVGLSDEEEEEQFPELDKNGNIKIT